MANNSKFDSQLDRMQYLMGYRVPTNESKRSNKVEYHTLGADNKVYGILKEGSMYYIMTTEQGKETIAESYSYINGFNYRNENGYKSYNEATKQLELKMISLNEAYHKHEDVSTVDTNRGRKNLAVLTEAARKELDRMHQIFENSQTIGKDNTGDPESKGKATDPTKQGDPFEKPVKAELDKDLKATSTVENADDNTKVEGVEKDLESDAMKTKKVDTAEEPKDTHDDLDGKGVADQHPTGAKAVKMNENFEFNPDDFHGDDIDAKIDSLVGDEELSDENLEDFATEEEPIDDIDKEEPIAEPEEGDSLNDELDTLIREFEETEKAMHGEEKNIESKIEGPDKVMDGPHGGLDVQGWNNEKVNEAVDRITNSVVKKLCEGQGWNKFKDVWSRRENLPQNDREYDELVDDEDLESWIEDGGRRDTVTRMPDNEPVDAPYYDEYGDATDSKYDKNGMRNGQIGTGRMDKLGRRAAVTAVKGLAKGNVALNKLKNRFTPVSREEAYLQEAIDRIVAEEVQKLDAWGKHPRYRKQPMSTPANKEVLAGTAEKDWNDDSVKGEQPYGQKIGNSDPFEKVVDLVLDGIKSKLQEGKKSKKA